MTGLVPSTLSALASARTAADFYRVSVYLQKFATPAEVRALVGNPAIPRGAFEAWLQNFHELVSLHDSLSDTFESRPFSDDVSFYVGGGTAKTLLIAFCGRAGLLCCPIAVLLRYFPSDAFDVLVLRDPDKRGFTAGVAHHSASFAELIAKLRSDFRIDQYRDIRCLGTSGGGAAALGAGGALKASSAVSFCGRPPTASSSYGQTPEAADLEEQLGNSMPSGGRAFAVYGANNPKDVRNAHQLRSLMEITLIPIAGLSDHNVVRPLHVRGELATKFCAVGLL